MKKSLINELKEEHSFELPIHNMWGTVTVSSKNGKFYMSLDDEVGEMRIEISEEFYNATLKEFKKISGLKPVITD